MPKFRITYVPAGIVGPTGDQIKTQEIYAVHARHAALKAEDIERATGVRVLTVAEVNPRADA